MPLLVNIERVSISYMGMEPWNATKPDEDCFVSISYMGMELEGKIKKGKLKVEKYQSPIWVWNRKSIMNEIKSESFCINLLYGYGTEFVMKNVIVTKNLYQSPIWVWNFI